MLNHSYRKGLFFLLFLFSGVVLSQPPKYTLEVRTSENEDFRSNEVVYSGEGAVLTVTSSEGGHTGSYTISTEVTPVSDADAGQPTHQLIVNGDSVDVLDANSGVAARMQKCLEGKEIGGIEVTETAVINYSDCYSEILAGLPGQYLTLYGAAPVLLDSKSFIAPVFLASSVLVSSDGHLEIELGNADSFSGLSTGSMTISQDGYVNIRGTVSGGESIHLRGMHGTVVFARQESTGEREVKDEMVTNGLGATTPTDEDRKLETANVRMLTEEADKNNRKHHDDDDNVGGAAGKGQQRAVVHREQTTRSGGDSPDNGREKNNNDSGRDSSSDNVDDLSVLVEAGIKKLNEKKGITPEEFKPFMDPASNRIIGRFGF